MTYDKELCKELIANEVKRGSFKLKWSDSWLGGYRNSWIEIWLDDVLLLESDITSKATAEVDMYYEQNEREDNPTEEEYFESIKIDADKIAEALVDDYIKGFEERDAEEDDE